MFSLHLLQFPLIPLILKVIWSPRYVYFPPFAKYFYCWFECLHFLCHGVNFILQEVEICIFFLDCCFKNFCYFWIFQSVKIKFYSRITVFNCIFFRLSWSGITIMMWSLPFSAPWKDLVMALLLIYLNLPALRIKSICL